MTLTPGTRLGVYEVTAQIGVGGMGEVYRATDTKLKRHVAIKILPRSLAADPDRLARFQREAEVLASLSHPNIAGIYGLEESEGMTALVMELVEGDDLSQRTLRGAIPIDEALPIAKQIAEALEAAHEQGIIHRDLKPANIKLRADGTVKVLDFGLAKAMEPPAGSSPSVSMSPTLSMHATQAGIILGTAAYMSPEQARGKTVDRRADIWAFGVVLFEMLTGRRAFEGDEIAITLAAVMMKDPDWRALPPPTPVALRQLLIRCLKKDAKARMRDIGDARLQIEELLAGAPEDVRGPAVPAARSRFQRAMPWAAAGALGLTLIVMAVVAGRRAGEVPPADGSVQFTIAPPENTSFGGPPPGGGTGVATQVAVSPDGRNIAFVAGTRPGYQIWLRAVASVTARPIPGTEGGTFPFWSPDGRFIGFFAGRKLKKVPIAGGDASELCDAPLGRGGSWSRDNVILFNPGGGGIGLLRVSGNGGVPTVVTTPDPATGETTHRWPHFLPDGRHFFYTAIAGAGSVSGSKPSIVRIGSLDPADPAVTLFRAESSLSYASGHVLFAREDTLMAQPFDPDVRQPTGEAFPLIEHVSREGSRYVGASASENGTLVYARDDSRAPTQLTWFDRAGRPLGTVSEPGRYIDVALSPNERYVAVALGTASPENLDIWIIDTASNRRSRLTVDPGADVSPIWSPDSTRVAFGGSRSGKASLREGLINTTAADKLLLEVSGTPSRPCDVSKGIGCNLAPSGWSPDGRYIAYTFLGSFPLTSDVLLHPLSGDRRAVPVAQTGFLEISGPFSPDGNWIAYTTDEDGQQNVSVQPFPSTGSKYPVSRDGGSQPVWRADGKELFYLGAGGTLMAVSVNAAREFAAGVPQVLFPTGAPARDFINQTYAATKDGKRFLVNAKPQQSASLPLTVVINWTATIQR